MSKEYPYDCVRCGMCCISGLCKIMQELLNKPEKTKCPVLMFDREGKAVCGAYVNDNSKKAVLAIGWGCSMKGSILIEGEEYNWSALPKPIKLLAVMQAKDGQIPIIKRTKLKNFSKL